MFLVSVSLDLSVLARDSEVPGGRRALSLLDHPRRASRSQAGRLLGRTSLSFLTLLCYYCSSESLRTQVRSFNLQTQFFHFEFFRLKKDPNVFLPLEANLRPPGTLLWTLSVPEYSKTTHVLHFVRNSFKNNNNKKKNHFLIFSFAKVASLWT